MADTVPSFLVHRILVYASGDVLSNDVVVLTIEVQDCSMMTCVTYGGVMDGTIFDSDFCSCGDFNHVLTYYRLDLQGLELSYEENLVLIVTTVVRADMVHCINGAHSKMS